MYLDKIASLTPAAKRIILERATEYPHSGAYNQLTRTGTYLCRRCGLALFRASQQFTSGCGWPSFDDSLSQSVKTLLDPDGRRQEIRCARCEAHLGHIFLGEQFTAKNKRYCVNSIALDWVDDSELVDSEEAIIAGGCFWGVEYFLRRLRGVAFVESGYTGGQTLSPTYEQVCQGKTGHIEAVRVIYNPRQTHYENVLKCFLEIHDPTQTMGQGPDMGYQYQSAIFYYNGEQKRIAHSLLKQLQDRGFKVTTQLIPVQVFWSAEDYHQNYYAKQKKQPYCHRYESRFAD